MVGRSKSAGLVAGFLAVLLPFITVAGNASLSVSPAQVRVDDLLPGETTEFELTIHNRDGIAHNFTFAVFPPPKEERREGSSWISFSSPKMEIPASSQAHATVLVAIPQEQRWAGRNWETWLAVTAESSDMLAVKLYVRLLVSTGGTRSNSGLIAGIAAVAVLLGCGTYFLSRRRTRPE